ncbi:hypothetical protein [Nonomuraea soli]|uniref:Uncharacterized protein n=1 Tax=Nonomuraea soli TaxID=1032476 RepID=A0A7W0CPR0_9ACTN|nr:hypothetical protein [Nonomuraea soli]MBA2895020.1 hypothetical protein [Nonomuraea soli]
MVKRWTPVLTLFLLAPLAAEFLLGNLPITMLIALISLAPLYGGGALLIREVSRRLPLGWTGIALLGLAFAVVQEAFVTGSLFDPRYAAIPMTDYAYLPGLGVSAWWTVFVLTLHSAWSVCAPIAVTEALSDSREPWLGRAGLGVAGALFAAGIVMSRAFTASPHQPSTAQLTGAAVGVAILIGAAVLLGRRPVPASARSAPAPLAVGAFTLTTGSLFWAITLIAGPALAWPTVAVHLVLAVATLVTLRQWSAGPGWDRRHLLAAAAGGLLTYAWHGFAQPPAVPTPPATDLAGDVLFAAATVGMLLAAAVRLSRTRNPAPAQSR